MKVKTEFLNESCLLIKSDFFGNSKHEEEKRSSNNISIIITYGIVYIGALQFSIQTDSVRVATQVNVIASHKVNGGEHTQCFLHGSKDCAPAY